MARSKNSNVTKEIADVEKLDKPRGALVASVAADG